MTATVTFHARGTLGLGPPVPAHLSVRTPAQRTTQKMGFTWHHVGAGGNLDRPNQVERLRAIYNYHVHTLGYGDIAYHAAFDADGNTYGLRDGQYVGAHASSAGNVANVLTDGVCFLEDDRGITPAALAAFEWWHNLYLWILHRPAQAFAHRWWAEGHGGTATACPGDDWDRVVRFVGGHW
jgi:hypothetical protein